MEEIKITTDVTIDENNQLENGEKHEGVDV